MAHRLLAILLCILLPHLAVTMRTDIENVNSIFHGMKKQRDEAMAQVGALKAEGGLLKKKVAEEMLMSTNAGTEKEGPGDDFHSAPKVNRLDLFSQICRENDGEFVNKWCKCAGYSSRPRVCMGRDGKIGGEGCSSKEYFVEEGCLMDRDAMQCPSCKVDPCGRNTNAELVEVPGRHGPFSDRYICSCKGADEYGYHSEKGRKEKYLCFDGDQQPGCPDYEIEGLRWSSGFMPFECEGCRCSITHSYDSVSWARNFKKRKGERLIYPDEDLCPSRGGSLKITRTQDEASALCECKGQASRCSCDEGKTFGGRGCETLTTFNPLTTRECKCQVSPMEQIQVPPNHTMCADPGPTNGPGSYHGPGHSSGRTTWHEGEKVQWTCDDGFGIVQGGVYTKVKTAEAECHNQVFNAHPPKCRSLIGLLKNGQKYQARKPRFVLIGKVEFERLYEFEGNGADLSVMVFKYADETEPRTVKPMNSLKCGASNVSPTFWTSEETLKNSLTCTGTFDYKHKGAWGKKPPSQVELTVVLGQNDKKALVIAAQEKWPEKEEPEEWMEVVWRR